MVAKLKVGIRNENSEREKKIIEIFTIVKGIIKNKEEFLYNIEIEGYENLKKEFHKDQINSFEKDNQKAITEFEKGIILFNDSFFHCSEINQKSVFLHEIGHLTNKPPRQAINNNQNPLVRGVYSEFLADYFLFNIDKNIFLNGRIITDLESISISKIKSDIETSINKDAVIKHKFIVVGRLHYYYSLYQHQPILYKIDELISIIKKYFPEINSILTNLKEVCYNLKSKGYQELEDLLDKLEIDIKNL